MGYKQYCKDYENIENYDKAKKDNFKGWECHHRLETHTSDGERRLVDITQAELIALGMYYNRPAEELIFLTIKEHHEYRKGKQFSEEHKKKLSEAKKGKAKSEETRKRMSEAHKGKQFSEETRKKIAEAKKNISEETRKKMSEAAKNMSEEHRNKLSETKKGENNPAYGKHWYNNGKTTIIAYQCPDGFTPGRLRK